MTTTTTTTTQNLVLGVVALALSLFALFFLFFSDFGCRQGNIGPIGLTGNQGPTGLPAVSTTNFTSGNDLANHNLRLGYEQVAFNASFLHVNAANYGTSTWVISAHNEPSNLVEFQFDVLDHTTQQTLFGFFVSQTLLSPRQELTTQIYMTRTNTNILTLIVAGLPAPVASIIPDFNQRVLSIKCTCVTGNATNRLNQVTIVSPQGQ